MTLQELNETTKRKWISIEVDLSGYEICIEDEGPWQQADMLIAEVEAGSTFEQFLESATFGFVDQDGGDSKIVPFDGSYMTSKQYYEIEQELACLWAQEIDKLKAEGLK